MWLSHSPLTFAHPQLSQHPQSQSELWILKCDRVSWPGDRLEAHTFVYDMHNYHCSNLYGPFVPCNSKDKPLRTNYIHAAHYMNILLNNLHNSHSNDTHLWMGCGFENTQAMTVPLNPMDGDWAGVKGDWLRFIAWLGHEDLERYNVRYLQLSAL